jgi:two-component system, OmpR family, sensor histidine kinase KdpD
MICPVDLASEVLLLTTFPQEQPKLWDIGRPDAILFLRISREGVFQPLAAEKAQRARENFFKESNLTALRELALRQTAHELELREIASASEERRPQQEPSSASPSSPKATIDRILIYVCADASTFMLIRRGPQNGRLSRC